MSKKLVKCKTCGADIAKDAKTCPSCGARHKKGHPILGILLILLARGIIGSALGGTEEKSLTLEKFNAVETGMSYSQVVDIVGFEGELGSQVDIGMGSEYKTEIYTWSNPGGSNMNVTFQGGKAISKAQFGLT